MTWKVVVRSAVGVSHQAQQLPCQDFGDYCVIENIVVGAVADGAGSARYANLGAKLAVEAALTYLTRIGTYLYKRPHAWQQLAQSPTEDRITQLFTRTLKKAIATLKTCADTHAYPVQDLACTLLVFVATPHWLAAMQIGDGFVVVRAPHQEYQLLFQPDKGEYINETTFITSDQAVSDMQSCLRFGSTEFICASTDGLEKVAIRLSDWMPFSPFFTPLEAYLHEHTTLELEDRYLIDFLNSERLNARTDDDKTLLLCIFN